MRSLKLLTFGFLGAEAIKANHKAPLHHYGGDIVRHEYLVKLRDDHSLVSHFTALGDNVTGALWFRYLEATHMYWASMDEETLAHVRYDDGVQYVEHNVRIDARQHLMSEPQPPLSYDRLQKRLIVQREEKAFYAPAILTNADKLADTVTDGTFPAFRWIGDPGSAVDGPQGTGVDIYVFDSGVRTSHSGFGGRASNFRGETNTPYCDNESMDDNRLHGTKVAGAAAGKRIRKRANHTRYITRRKHYQREDTLRR